MEKAKLLGISERENIIICIVKKTTKLGFILNKMIGFDLHLKPEISFDYSDAVYDINRTDKEELYISSKIILSIIHGSKKVFFIAIFQDDEKQKEFRKVISNYFEFKNVTKINK